MTLGQLIKELQSHDPEAEVKFDFAEFYPTTFMSWRGDYGELALSYEHGDTIRFVMEKPLPTVGDLLKAAHEANGRTFTGYKGGNFTMGPETEIWVAQYGESGETVLDGTKKTSYGNTVILITKHREYGWW